MPSIFRPVTAFARKAFKLRNNTEKTLARKLDAVERAHPAPRFSIEGEFTDYTERGRDYLYIHHIFDKIDGDGLWKCCRGHEQELIHWKGDHPFKHLRCNSCEHILCHQCESTTVLTRLERGVVLADKAHKISGLVSYGQICPSCGLTHRSRSIQSILNGADDRVCNTTFDGVLCACGRLADETWLRFWIGPIYEYRLHPHEAFAILSRQRAESSVRRNRERGARQESLPYGSSSRDNTDSNLSVSHAQWSSASLTSSISRPSSRPGQPSTPWTASSVSLDHVGLQLRN